MKELTWTLLFSILAIDKIEKTLFSSLVGHLVLENNWFQNCHTSMQSQTPTCDWILAKMLELVCFWSSQSFHAIGVQMYNLKYWLAQFLHHFNCAGFHMFSILKKRKWHLIMIMMNIYHSHQEKEFKKKKKKVKMKK